MEALICLDAKSQSAGVKSYALGSKEQKVTPTTCPLKWTGKLSLSPKNSLIGVRRYMSKLKKAYLRYLESGHWKALRRQAFERDGYRCTECPSNKNLQGHHKRYRKDLRKCTMNDIVTLCKKCHEEWHRRKAQERKMNRKRKLDLVSVLLDFSADN